MRPFLILLTTLATCASAQVFEAGAGGGVSRLSNRSLGSLSDGTTSVPVTLDDGWRFGFRMTLNNWPFFGHEFGYGYNRTKLLIGGVDNGGMAIHQGFYNFLAYATPEGNRVRPFVTGGGHFSNYVPPGASATSGGGTNKFGINYGGGIKVRVLPTWGIRLDYRQYRTPKPFDLPGVSGWLNQTEISAGVMFML